MKTLGGLPSAAEGGHVSRRFDLGRPILFFSNYRFKSLNSCNFHWPNSLVCRVQRVCATGVVVSIFIFLRGWQVGHAGWVGCDSVWAHSGSGNGDRTSTQQSQMAWAPSQHGRSTQDTTPVLQGSDRGGKLGGRIWDLGGRPMNRHWNLPAPLSCTNWCSPVARSHRRDPRSATPP